MYLNKKLLVSLHDNRTVTLYSIERRTIKSNAMKKKINETDKKINSNGETR